MKIIKRIILFVLLFGLFYGIYYAYSRLPLVTGYAAKDMCSCVFIADREPQDVLDNEFQFSLVKYANAEVDQENHSVTATVLGMAEKTAYFHPKKGCAVLKKSEVSKFMEDVDFNWEDHTKQTTLMRNPSQSGVDYVSLNKVINQSFVDPTPKKPFGTRAVIVIKDGEIIGEKYSEGFDANSLHIGWSMTKSVFNALVGIAIKQGYISSINEKPSFKEWKNDDRSKITIKNLLQMNSGLDWDEDYGNISTATTMLYDRGNMLSYAKSLGLEGEIGEHWEYSSGTSNLISGLLKQRFLTYDKYFKFPYEQLFTKIGAPSFFMETDAKGLYVASSYAWATAEDWGKFGMLYANNGRVNEVQILPEDWVEFSREEASGSDGAYGAQFWLPLEKDFPNAPEDMFYCDGFQGQRIFIIPSKKVVIVRMALTRFEHPNYNELVSGVLNAIN